MSASANFALPVGCRGRLLHDPQWIGEVVATTDNDGLRVSWRVSDSLATGKHSTDGAGKDRQMKIVAISQSSFPVGSRVLLRSCPYGQPGTVLRIERRKVVVYWRDLDFLSRHSPELLILAVADNGCKM